MDKLDCPVLVAGAVLICNAYVDNASSVPARVRNSGFQVGV